MTKNQRRSQRRKARKAAKAEKEHDDADGEDCPDIVGMRVQTRNGRPGVVIAHDPDDSLFEFKILFSDANQPRCDWLSGEDVFAEECIGDCCKTGRLPKSTKGQGTCEPSLGGQEMPTAALPGGPGLLPVAGRPGGDQQPGEADEPDELFDLPTDGGAGEEY